MEAHAVERHHLDREVILARPIFLLLALVSLLEVGRWTSDRVAVIFLVAYLAVALILALLASTSRWGAIRIPLWLEIAALLAFLVLTPSVTPFWFLYLFVVFAGASEFGFRLAAFLAGGATVGMVVRAAVLDPAYWPHIASWVGLAAGSYAAGAGIGFFGARERQSITERRFLTHLTGLLRVERGLAESVRELLEELRSAFMAEKALLVFRDEDLERIFVWTVREDDNQPIRPSDLPTARGDAYLLDHPMDSIAWNNLNGSGDGFGWNCQDGRPLAELPRLPGPSQRELNLHSLLTTVLEFEGQPVGRVLLCNGKRKFTSRDLRRLERIVRHLARPMQNLFLLRHLRARAVESERSRLSHDLHDGILQTLLSLDIQLDVLRRKLPQAPDQVATELAGLQQTVRKEGAELRRMVTDLRPVRVESADLLDLMRGFAERFRHESGLALDLLVDSRDPQLSDRVCRELFQIYREALNNVKKHAHATHVVVKLWQDEAKAFLVVDDNGQGFSFAGRFNSDELDRLRLGPISIKDRTRSVGGTLTIESNPGNGARVTVEIPLS